jgi:hypothetical protein
VAALGAGRSWRNPSCAGRRLLLDFEGQDIHIGRLWRWVRCNRGSRHSYSKAMGNVALELKVRTLIFEGHGSAALQLRVTTLIFEGSGGGCAAIEGQDFVVRRQWRWMRCN